MAFEVTATRRRPKTFAELAGQEFVSATLSASIQAEHTAHAYLFSGPRGCGKTSAARILARALNCSKSGAAEPCGVCPSCKEISAGSSLDVIEIDGASNTGVNDVRQIKDEVLFPPQASRYKIYIIDEVHMLSTSAFNALLKTIEEPPPYIVFIFATTELHKVPATIKSRCQQFAFKLIPIETIQGLLRAACEELGIQAEDEALFWIARESTGSLRDAYTLFDQVASFSEGHIRAQLIREKLGLVGLENLNMLAEACAKGSAGEALAALDAIIAAGVSIEQFTIDLASYYRSLLLIKSGVTREALTGHAVERFSAAVLAALDTARLEEAVRLLLALFRDIRYSVSPRFELESAIVRLSALSNWVAPAELYRSIQEVRRCLGIQGGEVSPLAADRIEAAGPPLRGLSLPPSAGGGGAGIARPSEAGRDAAAAPPATPPAAPAKLSLSEGFQRRLADAATGQTSKAEEPPPARTAPPAAPVAEPVPPDVELVRRVFEGTIL